MKLGEINVKNHFFFFKMNMISSNLGIYLIVHFITAEVDNVKLDSICKYGTSRARKYIV